MSVSEKRSFLFSRLDNLISKYPGLIKGIYTDHEFREHDYEFHQVGNTKVCVSADCLYLNKGNPEVEYVESFLEQLIKFDEIQ